MKPNLIILTTGLSGSSVLTGLIARAGYWTGERTHVKNNSTGSYNTYENSKLVELNNQLIKLTKCTITPHSWYDRSLFARFEAIDSGIDRQQFRQFIDECNEHSPWIWKDPKLWFTLAFWLDLLGEKNVRCIVLYRDPYRLWVSQTNKRIIYDYQYLKNSEQRSRLELLNYLHERNVPSMELQYDELLDCDTQTLIRINQFLGCQLSSSDWGEVFDSSKQSNSKRLNDLKAMLIYLKNYKGRIK